MFPSSQDLFFTYIKTHLKFYYYSWKINCYGNNLSAKNVHKIEQNIKQFDPVDNMYNYDLWDQKNKWGDPKISPKPCRSSLQITVHQEKNSNGA